MDFLYPSVHMFQSSQKKYTYKKHIITIADDKAAFKDKIIPRSYN